MIETSEAMTFQIKAQHAITVYAGPVRIALSAGLRSCSVIAPRHLAAGRHADLAALVPTQSSTDDLHEQVTLSTEEQFEVPVL